MRFTPFGAFRQENPGTGSLLTQTSTRRSTFGIQGHINLSLRPARGLFRAALMSVPLIFPLIRLPLQPPKVQFGTRGQEPGRGEGWAIPSKFLDSGLYPYNTLGGFITRFFEEIP